MFIPFPQHHRCEVGPTRNSSWLPGTKRGIEKNLDSCSTGCELSQLVARRLAQANDHERNEGIERLILESRGPDHSEGSGMINRHPFHSICPYFAMFPEQFVEQQLLTYTSPGDLVFDPFCGRGTTVFESLLRGRDAAGSDINPVAACVARAKATAPTLQRLLSRLDDLEEQYNQSSTITESPAPFFSACFHPDTLAQLLFARSALKWKRSSVDCFLTAVMLGILHGESHRTDLCLSNRMPRTISTKPEYSIRWWKERGLVAPFRDVFSTLRKAVAFRYRLSPASSKGRVSHSTYAESVRSSLN